MHFAPWGWVSGQGLQMKSRRLPAKGLCLFRHKGSPSRALPQLPFQMQEGPSEQQKEVLNSCQGGREGGREGARLLFIPEKPALPVHGNTTKDSWGGRSSSGCQSEARSAMTCQSMWTGMWGSGKPLPRGPQQSTGTPRRPWWSFNLFFFN